MANTLNSSDIQGYMKLILMWPEKGAEIIVKLQIGRAIVVDAEAVEIAKDRSDSNVELQIC